MPLGPNKKIIKKIKAEACDKSYVSASLERARLRFERSIRVE